MDARSSSASAAAAAAASAAASASGSASGSAAAPAATEDALRLLLTGLEVNVVIGVYPGERDRAQRLRIDLELEAEPPSAYDDDFAKVVDYGEMAERVKRCCAENEAHLLETLGDRILTACLAEPRVHAARVRIQKLDLERAAAGIGIELSRRRGARRPA